MQTIIVVYSRIIIPGRMGKPIKDDVRLLTDEMKELLQRIRNLGVMDKR